MVYCGNNAYEPSLRVNGGRDVFGTHEECLRKGYARGYNQAIKDIPHFVQKWAGRYRAHINQKLWHSDAQPLPPGYQLATLSQTMGKGYAMGSVAIAKKMVRKSGVATSSQKRKPQKPTLPLRTFSRRPSQPLSSPRLSHQDSAGAFRG